MKITVDNPKITGVSTSFREDKESLDQKIENIEEILSNIATVWEGSDALKFINVFENKYIVGLKDLSKCLEEYAIYLGHVPEAFNMLDDTFSNQEIDV